MEMDFGRVRQHFPALRNHTYLNTAGIGVTPQPVTEEIQRLFGQWSTHGATTPVFRKETEALVVATRERAARLFGAKVEELAFTGRVAESLHIVTDGLEWRPGDEVITSDEEVLYMPLHRLAKDYGVVIKKMRFAYDKDQLLNRFVDLLGPRTRLIWFSDTTNKSGIHIPAREICDLAHERGALVMLDGAQTAGQFPLNLKEIDCDFYAITGYKWLLGPYACGLCYVREELIPQVRALRVGRAVVDYFSNSYEEDESALRYEFGVRNVILRIGFGKTLEYVAGLGMENIHRRIMRLRDYLWKGLDELPRVHIASPRDARMNSGITCAVLEGKEPQEVVAKAWEANIVIVPVTTVPVRPDLRGVRISPSFYNTKDDIDRILEVIGQLVL